MLRAVTFDFWDTLLDGSVTSERTAARLARLHAAIVGAGHACTPEGLAAAFERAGQRVAGEARDTLIDVGPPGRWAALAAELGITDDRVPFAVVEKAYEDITLEPPPDLLPGAGEAVWALRGAGYRLGVICNTGLTGGRVLRQVLDRHGLLAAFHTTVFSNEVGRAKPHPAIFARALDGLGITDPSEALHVGDREDLDVRGALDSGLRAARYAPSGDPATEAEVVVRSWRDFAGVVAHLATITPPRPRRSGTAPTSPPFTGLD